MRRAPYAMSILGRVVVGGPDEEDKKAPKSGFVEFLKKLTPDAPKPTNEHKTKRALNTLASKAEDVLAMRGVSPRTVAHNLTHLFPELRYYTTEFGGEIAVSPGVVKTDDVELYRTVGAMVALYSLLRNDHQAIVKPDGSSSVKPFDYNNMSTKLLDECEFVELDGDDRDAAYYLMAIHDVGKSAEFRNLVNGFLDDANKTDNHDTVLGHALRIMCDTAATGYLEVAAALPTLREHISSAWKLQLACAFESDFHLPQVMQGEASVLAFDGLFESKKQGLTRQACAIYLYHSLFDVAGTLCTEASIVPTVIPVPYTTWPVYIAKIVDRLFPRTDPIHTTGIDLYRSVLRDAALSQKSGKINEAIGADSSTDDDFAFLRLMAMTRWQFADPLQLKKVFELEQYAPLRAELAGKVEGSQLMLYYSPDLIRKTLFSDVAEKKRVDATIEVESYPATLDILAALFALARADLADDQRKTTVEVNVVALVNKLKEVIATYEAKVADKREWNIVEPVVEGGVDAYLGGRTLERVWATHEASLKWNEHKTEAQLVLKAKAKAEPEAAE